MEHDAPKAATHEMAQEERVENANFLQEEDEDANVDAMLDSLFDEDED